MPLLTFHMVSKHLSHAPTFYFLTCCWHLYNTYILLYPGKKLSLMSARVFGGDTRGTLLFFSPSIANWQSTISIWREQINTISRVTNAGRDCGNGPLTAIARFVHARMDGKTRYHLYLPFNSLSSYLFPTLKMPDDDSVADGDDYGM